MPTTVVLRLLCPHWPPASRRASLLRVRRRGAWRTAGIVETQGAADNISASSRNRPAAHQLNPCEARETLQLAAVGHYQDRISHAQAPPSETGPPVNRPAPSRPTSPPRPPIHPLSVWAKMPIRRKPETSSPAKNGPKPNHKGAETDPTPPEPRAGHQNNPHLHGRSRQEEKATGGLRQRKLSPADLTAPAFRPWNASTRATAAGPIFGSETWGGKAPALPAATRRGGIPEGRIGAWRIGWV